MFTYKYLMMQSKMLMVTTVAISGLLVACSEDDDPIRPSEEETETEPADTICGVPVMYISTNDIEIDSKEHYFACHISLDGKGVYENYESEQNDSIRGRGNSTWEWYDKKPYKIKLDHKESLLGMGAGKHYVLLANYRDPTKFMNAVTFDMARYMGLKYTNTNRFVEVYLNGEYIGFYQLTEQIEQGSGRVAVDKENGVLISLDYDDGPDLSPDNNDNFYSEVFNSSYSWWGLPVCVKYPDDPTEDQLDEIRDDFITLEKYIKKKDYDGLKTRLDVQSMMDFLIIQELTRNVELVTPRSMYMYRDEENMWHFGPVWDFDGGFAFNWGNHNTYFVSQSWLMGPKGEYDIPDFFDKMFDNSEYLADYKARWDEINQGMLQYVFEHLDSYQEMCHEAMVRDFERWPITKDYDTEIGNMKEWLQTRADNYTTYLSTWK